MHNLPKLLANHLNAQICPINAIHKTCCHNSMLPVVDFDKVKEAFCKQFSIGHTLCSADCLYIDPSKGVICFIEMKNISMHLWSTAKQYKNPDNFSHALGKWLEDLHYSLKDKFIDSVFIITAIAGLYGADTNELAGLLNRDNVKIKYAVVAYMKSADYLTYKLATLNVKVIKHGILAEPDYASHLLTNDSEFDAFILEHL